MKFLNLSLEANKILSLAFLVAMLVMKFGRFNNIMPALGTYGLLLFMKYYLESIHKANFYEYVNVGFIIALNLCCWIIYIFTAVVDMSAGLHM